MENENLIGVPGIAEFHEETESIKLVKNTKGFNWEIKLRGNPISDETVSRLDQLNKQMESKYGAN